jgi:hypothetical protein
VFLCSTSAWGLPHYCVVWALSGYSLQLRWSSGEHPALQSCQQLSPSVNRLRDTETCTSFTKACCRILSMLSHMSPLAWLVPTASMLDVRYSVQHTDPR